MINILIPAMGTSLFFKDSYFPKPMIEVAGEPMLEKVVKNFQQVLDPHFIFVFSKKECCEFHLDDSAKMLTPGQNDIISLDGETAGALCTCLMAVHMINNDDPLIISNSDQIIDIDYNDVISAFAQQQVAAGVITFESIHPRWSYAQVENSTVIQVTEKRPISKNAIAGVYFFQHGRDFVEAAKRVILKQNTVNNRYYISSSINEIILMNKPVGIYEISKEQYHPFYSPEKIKEYEQVVQRRAI